ncbi:MAG: pro-sigmaK processing inhibitor BofA family protein [Bacilli bacterium]|nr:pro-sigmaK processing inhibitor BofA family protein [Bacilli bacterium]
MKKFLKWFFKSLFIALIIIFAINLLGSFININIPLNFWTILIITIFRLPGAIILIIFFLL